MIAQCPGCTDGKTLEADAPFTQLANCLLKNLDMCSSHFSFLTPSGLLLSFPLEGPATIRMGTAQVTAGLTAMAVRLPQRVPQKEDAVGDLVPSAQTQSASGLHTESHALTVPSSRVNAKHRQAD